MRLHDRALHRKLVVNPHLYLPEAYMDGTLTVEDGGDIYALIELMVRNDDAMVDDPLWRLIARMRRLTRRLHQYNPVPRSRQNVAHHYDLSDQLYDLFLDRDRQYSCAYFRQPRRRHRHRAAQQAPASRRQAAAAAGDEGARYRLRLGRAGAVPRERMRGRRHRPHPVDRAAQGRAAPRRRRPGSPTACAFICATTAKRQGSYDRIVSVGMFEHVGRQPLPRLLPAR